MSEESPQGLVTILNDSSVQLSIKSVADAKLALKMLRLEKKSLSLAKRQNAAQLRELKLSHRNENAGHGPAIRGRGGFFAVARSIQQISKASTRNRQLAELGPFEGRKSELDALSHNLDAAILRIETYIHENS